MMARVGEEFPLECPNCGGNIRLIAARRPIGPTFQVHHDRNIFQTSTAGLPVIHVHSLWAMPNARHQSADGSRALTFRYMVLRCH